MTNTIFVGSVYPQQMLEEIIERKEHIDFAANTFQRSLLEGISLFYNKVTVITSPVTSTFPKSSTFKYGIQKIKEDMGNGMEVIMPGFWNFPFLKMMSEFFNIKQALQSKIKEADIVYIYALHSPFLLAAYFLRKKLPKVCIIVPDIPEYMSHNNGFFRRFAKKLNRRIIDKCLRAFDSFVLLSPYMRDVLPIGNKPWIQIEGMFTDSFASYQETAHKPNTILYTGMISSKYGVFDLIEAVHRINNKDYQLWLCGSCRGEFEQLEQYTKEDTRIKYLGMIRTEEVRKLQRQVMLLVNPRHSNEEFTKYSFPSKTMEYMASGTPTLMCKLPAIPQEYYQHLYFFDDESIEGIKDKIIEISSLPQEVLSKKGQLARDFILKNKSAKAQAAKIYNFNK